MAHPAFAPPPQSLLPSDLLPVFALEIRHDVAKCPTAVLVVQLARLMVANGVDRRERGQSCVFRRGEDLLGLRYSSGGQILVNLAESVVSAGERMPTHPHRDLLADIGELACFFA